LFTIEKFTIVPVIWEMVRTINVVLKKLVTWRMGDRMQGVRMEFKNWCGMLNVMNVIDNTHIGITKPSNVIAKDYYYHKITNYNIVTQVVVDN
jgi:hypothetical protein